MYSPVRYPEDAGDHVCVLLTQDGVGGDAGGPGEQLLQLRLVAEAGGRGAVILAAAVHTHPPVSRHRVEQHSAHARPYLQNIVNIHFTILSVTCNKVHCYLPCLL